MDSTILGLVVLLGGVIGARLLMEAAMKELAPDQKVALLDAMAPQRKYGLIVLVVVIVAFYRRPVLLMAGVLAYLVVTTVLTQRTMRRINLPVSYRRSHLVAVAVSTAGLLAFLIVTLWPVAGVV